MIDSYTYIDYINHCRDCMFERKRIDEFPCQSCIKKEFAYRYVYNEPEELTNTVNTPQEEQYDCLRYTSADA